MGELDTGPERNLPPGFVLREMVVERAAQTGRQLQLVKLELNRDALWALYGDDKVRIDFLPFRVVLTAFRLSEGPRPVVQLRLVPNHPVAPTRWTLSGRAGEDFWLVADAVFDQLESLAETMAFRFRPNAATWGTAQPSDFLDR